MADFASPQETQRALAILLDLQSEDPNGLDGILHKYANPFTTWPLLAEPTRAFLSFFETPARSVETNGTQQNINPKIQELVEEFDREYAAAKKQQINAETASKKFVNALKEHAKKSNTTPPETQAPVPRETESVPVSPERVQEIIGATVRQPVEEKELFFHALTSFASEQPAQSITNLIPRAASVTQASRVLVSPEEVIPKETLFSPRAAGVFQQLDTVVNHPERIPKTTLTDMTARWGENFVNSPWFTKLQGDANRMIADQKAAAKIMGRVSSLFSDISTTVLRGPIDQNVITYIETYRLVAAGGVPMANPSQFGGIALGYGGQLVRMSGSYVIRTGAKAVIKKAAISGATKLGIEVATGAATGGLGWLAAAGASALGWLKDRGSALLRGIFFMGTSKNPEDNFLLVVGAGVVLVFFLPIFPLLNIPAFNQSMIDTSIVTGVGGGIGEGPGINCQTTPDDPQCKFTPCVGDCRWPTSGYITQGPRTAQFCAASANPTHGSGSSSSQNAIDFSSMDGGAVYATRVGTIERIYTGCPESGATIDPWCGGGPDPTNPGDEAHSEYAGYGNHVVLRTDSGYTIIFGHLKSAIAVRYGQKITDPNTQIGWVDNSGHSFGTHLHWGVLSGGNVLDLVPTNDPALTPATIDGCIQQTQGCTKICPTTPVTAGS